MNKCPQNPMLTVRQGAVSAIFARHVAADTNRSRARCSDPRRSGWLLCGGAGGGAQTYMERDIVAQVAWLTQQAAKYGYANLQELFAGAPDAYNALAATWRRLHPSPLAA